MLRWEFDYADLKSDEELDEALLFGLGYRR